MRGHILVFQPDDGTGLITSQDGSRRTFSLTEWKETNVPHKGQLVDFELNAAGQAIAIYLAYDAQPVPFNAPSPVNSAPLTHPRLNYSMGAWFKRGIENYINFSGRAERREYWYLLLFSTLISIGLTILDAFFFGFSPEDLGFLSTIFFIFCFLPSISIGVRRLHDIGKSGWWLLLIFIPLIGAIILLIWFCTKGHEASNAYGPEPQLLP